MSLRLAISESVLSDFNRLRRHSGVIVVPRREAASKDAPMRTAVAESWNVLETPGFPRGSLSHEVRGARPFRTGNLLSPPVLNAETLVALLVESCRRACPNFLKNNTKLRPAWQEIVDFS